MKTVAGMLACALAAITGADGLQTCDKILNINIYFTPLLSEPSLVPCMKASSMTDPGFLTSNRAPSRKQMALFFGSPECRTFFDAVRKNYNSVPSCAIDSYGTDIKHLSSMTFDQIKAVYFDVMKIS